MGRTDNKIYHPGLILRLLQDIIGIINTTDEWKLAVRNLKFSFHLFQFSTSQALLVLALAARLAVKSVHYVVPHVQRQSSYPA